VARCVPQIAGPVFQFIVRESERDLGLQLCPQRYSEPSPCLIISALE
jgi:hypothetical protein